MGTMTTCGNANAEFYNGYIRLTTTKFTYQHQRHKRDTTRWSMPQGEAEGRKRDFMIKDK